MLSAPDPIKQLTFAQKTVLKIVRIAIKADNTPSQDNLDELISILTSVDENFWREMHVFAAVQGFSALAFETIKDISPEIIIPRRERIAWAVESETAIRKYKYFCETAPKLEALFMQRRLIPVHMKGLSLSILYPRPELRECGDYDFYLYNCDEPLAIQDLKLNAFKGECLADSCGIMVDTKYPKHGVLVFKGIHGECHRTLLNVESLQEAYPVEECLHNLLTPIIVRLPFGEEIHAASLDFSKIFVAFHALQHSGCGLRIRHIIDWAMLCRAYGKELPGEGYSEILHRGAASLSAISDMLLATDFNVMADSKLTTPMLSAILTPDRYEAVGNWMTNIKNYPVRFGQYLRFHNLRKYIFPNYESLWVSLMHSLKYKLQK